MQERASQPLHFRLDEIGPVLEPGTIVFIKDAVMGISRVVSSSGFPGPVEDQIESQAGSRIRKTYQVSLLSCELRRRDLRGAQWHAQDTLPEEVHARGLGRQSLLGDRVC